MMPRTTRILALAATCVVTCAGSASALTDTQWVNRVWSDSLHRPPTSIEVNSALATLATATTPVQKQTARFDIGKKVLTSPDWEANLIGANPNVPGYFQVLLGRHPTFAELSLNQCRMLPDETVLYIMIADAVISTTCDPNYPTQPTGPEYAARAHALNPGLYLCSAESAVIDQICQDLLGRHATTAQLNVSAAPGRTRIATAVEDIIGDGLFRQASLEYRERVVDGAFLRFLRRAPRDAPFTSPAGDSASERTYFAEGLHPSLYSQEDLFAWLMCTPEYDTALLNTLPAMTQVPNPAPITVAQTIFEAPPQGGSLPFTVQSVPPIMINPVVLASTRVTSELTQENSQLETTVSAQLQVIDGLITMEFEGSVDETTARELLDATQEKLNQVAALTCPPNAECWDVPRAVTRAQSVINLGEEALDSGSYEEAARKARHAYQDALRLEKKISQMQP
jgi:hypothetical protein